ncbi:MAG: hypothetical protein LBR10_12900 [Prevotellaceae bacterium]|nr:hypothetical protein [Prevotellaceae bacterium]
MKIILFFSNILMFCRKDDKIVNIRKAVSGWTEGKGKTYSPWHAKTSGKINIDR